MHGAKRKLLARPFSKTSLRLNWESMVRDKVKTIVEKIKAESSTDGQANVFKWFSFMATDIIGLVAFGEDFHMSETGVVSLHSSFIS
jgi:cytochrome P450